MEAVLTVISKVAVMLILIVVGYLVTKKGMLTERGRLGNHHAAHPNRHPLPDCQFLSHLRGQPQPGGAAALRGHLGPGHRLEHRPEPAFLPPRRPEGRKKVLRFAVSFSNAGFMGLPLVEGIVAARA